MMITAAMMPIIKPVFDPPLGVDDVSVEEVAAITAVEETSDDASETVESVEEVAESTSDDTIAESTVETVEATEAVDATAVEEVSIVPAPFFKTTLKPWLKSFVTASAGV